MRYPSRLIALLAALALAGGCTWTPEAEPQRDALAKEFLTHPAAATIYVYRSEFNQYDTDSVLYVNGRMLGQTAPGTYFRIDNIPGRVVLHGTGIDMGEMSLDARAGQIYFVALDVVGGHSSFRVVPQEVGRQRVKSCCVLQENWALLQRPLVVR